MTQNNLLLIQLEMKFTTFVFVSSLMVLQLQAQTFSFVKQLGGPSNDVGYAIAVDASGNQYTTGSFSGTADFQEGPGTYNLTSQGSDDIFISKRDAGGNLVWAKQMGGPTGEYGRSIAVDANGNVCITGSFTGTIDFDPGPGVFNLSCAGWWDIFICKLDASGNFAWAKALGTTGEDHGNGITVDAAGNVYTTGSFYGTADFDPGPGTAYLTADYIDVFVNKFDAAGNFVWAKRMGGISYDYGYCIAVDGSSNVYITGSFRFTNCDYDPGPGTFYLGTYADTDGFLCKLDASGNFAWAKQLTTGAYDYSNSYALAIDLSGNIYLTGHFKGTTDFDPGPGVYRFTASALHDIFVCKLNSAGNFVWAKQFGGCQSGTSNSVAVDAAGNVYTTGVYQFNADFDPGPVYYRLSYAGANDAYINKLDPSGNFVWAKPLGGASDDFSYSVALDPLGNIYTTGYFGGVADFDPEPTVFNITATGGTDIFVHKMSQATAAQLPLIWTDFTVAKQGDQCHLSWRTSNEQNTSQFTIQHSTNGVTWTDVGTVAAAGNSNTAKDYRFLHLWPLTGINHYRLLQTDKDGSITYSVVRSIRLSVQAFPLVILNHPITNGSVRLQVRVATAVSLYAFDGSLLWQKQLKIGTETIDVSGYVKGVYLLRTDAGESRKLVVQ